MMSNNAPKLCLPISATFRPPLGLFGSSQMTSFAFCPHTSLETMDVESGHPKSIRCRSKPKVILRHCLIPADGFLEWKRTGRERRLYYIQSVHDAPVMSAGIWDIWRNRGEAITSCAIILTPANELVSDLHDRMPTILLREFEGAWLNPKTNRVELLRMLSPFPSFEMKMHPVSNSVNSLENDSPHLLIPIDAEVGQTLSLF